MGHAPEFHQAVWLQVICRANPFPPAGQLVGVVGPNGCGKSNIMDAVRWVLGESKASELRGESMQDVIFNGSGNRKPASRASVELVFDNALARAGGQWNQFCRDRGQARADARRHSSYFINNQPVRRRDGTCSWAPAWARAPTPSSARAPSAAHHRVQARRAAHVPGRSRGRLQIQERRRETENRLKDTRENLTRVDDILRELGANLDKLERQAEVATRYHALQKRARPSCTSCGSSSTATRPPKRPASKGNRWRPPTSSKAAWPSCATPRPSWSMSARPTSLTPPATLHGAGLWLAPT